MRLNAAELQTLIARLRQATCPPVVTLNGTDYRLVAAYNNPAHPAVVGLQVNDNRPVMPRLTLMTSDRFGVPSLSSAPDISFRLTLSDIVDMVAQGPTGKAGYCKTAWHTLPSIWRHGLQPETWTLQSFIRQTANTGAIMNTYDGATCFQSIWWACKPKESTTMERIIPVIVSHLVARDAAASIRLESDLIVADVVSLLPELTRVPVAA
jgi:hypothetical protein